MKKYTFLPSLLYLIVWLYLCVISLDGVFAVNSNTIPHNQSHRHPRRLVTCSPMNPNQHYNSQDVTHTTLADTSDSIPRFFDITQDVESVQSDQDNRDYETDPENQNVQDNQNSQNIRNTQQISISTDTPVNTPDRQYGYKVNTMFAGGFGGLGGIGGIGGIGRFGGLGGFGGFGGFGGIGGIRGIGGVGGLPIYGRYGVGAGGLPFRHSHLGRRYSMGGRLNSFNDYYNYRTFPLNRGDIGGSYDRFSANYPGGTLNRRESDDAIRYRAGDY